ncbi:hypothetical protein JW968_04275 [Candidatus Woesearchaeota archaeon]|nr:hypothetical protein [Candidatus Woesearchaeota archaeon]
MKAPGQYYEDVVLRDPAHRELMENYIAYRLGLARRDGGDIEIFLPSKKMSLEVLMARIAECRSEYCGLRQKADGMTDISETQFSRMIDFLRCAADPDKALKDEFRILFIYGLMRGYDLSKNEGPGRSGPPEIEKMLTELAASEDEEKIDMLVAQLSLFESILMDNIRRLPQTNELYAQVKARYSSSDQSSQ